MGKAPIIHLTTEGWEKSMRHPDSEKGVVQLTLKSSTESRGLSRSSATHAICRFMKVSMPAFGFLRFDVKGGLAYRHGCSRHKHPSSDIVLCGSSIGAWCYVGTTAGASGVARNGKSLGMRRLINTAPCARVFSMGMQHCVLGLPQKGKSSYQ